MLFKWAGTKHAPYGDIITPQRLPSLDYSELNKKTISTEVTCFITGTYITDRGKIFTIRQRYSVYVRYNRDTLREVMSRVRQMIIDKFNQENEGFTITDIFIPEFMTPSAIPEPTYLYRGGKIFRYITRYNAQQGKFMLDTEKEIYKSKASRIIAKYGLKRREGQIRRL